MKKNALFVFNGDPLCFIHVLLNALDMKEKGGDVQIVMEGASVKLIPELKKEDHPLYGLWKKVRIAGLLAGVCEACSRKMGTLENAKEQELVLLNDMNGHPSMSRFQQEGYEIISF